MDDFRKPYEYEEETVIWPVRIFCIMMLSLELFLSLIYLFQLNNILADIPVVRSIAITLSILYKVFILICVILLFKNNKYAIKAVKSFLITRSVYLITCTIVVFSYTINNKNAIGTGYGQFQSVRDIIIMLLVSPILYNLVFGISWYIYFNKSKKVEEVYAQNSNDNA